ncbi:hypothetical protein CHELA1G11_40162 [Hyphomicrobiales bacterium]|nr:hypothetical protein CHELA1G2_40149 [Hyphomicrobiales bacterium]CAH1696651.1 hypothetical protein CHELA1G11_40162 [Hyphomicrobiales bacterium]
MEAIAPIGIDGDESVAFERENLQDASAHPVLSCILALRLRQIERTFPTQAAFIRASRLSRSTLLLLR